MSTVLDSNKIDGIATTNGDSTLVMLIIDPLDYENEYEHLMALQDKINSYIAFIEDKQYMDIENFNKEFEDFIFEIAFMHSPTENCVKFLDVVQNQIAELKIKIQYEVG